mmetsp:Transcript_116777/g.250970  ORF Transcript_116777/g.250970 Transcript_116777/m.250970 type:complete len:116 (+) Transcript_116777:217-564(+)
MSDSMMPKYPSLFMKPTTTIAAHADVLSIPKLKYGNFLDYEAEMAIVIGKTCKDVNLSDAMDCVIGFTCANDLSERKWQKNAGNGQWVRGKSFDQLCPIGPVLSLDKDRMNNLEV